MDGRVYLKIKLKSLAAESRIIRHEERKRKVSRANRGVRHNGGGKLSPEVHKVAVETRKYKAERRAKRRSRDWYPKSVAELHELQLHRRNVVSKEARLTHIAYAYIRGRTLAQTDGCKGLLPDDWRRIATMVKKYASKDGGVDNAGIPVLFERWLMDSYPDRFMRLATDPATAVIVAAA